jgi:hypothetical protein
MCVFGTGVVEASHPQPVQPVDGDRFPTRVRVSPSRIAIPPLGPSNPRLYTFEYGKIGT